MLGRSKSKRPVQREISADSLQPLLVDYFTRDGSTLTMRLLASSPQIAVGAGYPYEHKYFAYLYRWAHLIEKTEWPGKVWNPMGLATLSQEKQMPLMGAPPWKERELLDPAQGGELFSDYAFRVLWEEFSRRATAQTRDRHKRPDAAVRYYAEKHLSTWQVDLSELPPVRVIAVLRDPRDTYVSITSFAEKREKAGRKRSMGQQPGESHDAWLKRHLARQRDRLRWIRKAMDSGDMPVVRYENLVLSLDEEARRLEEILGVELDPAAVAADEKMRATHVSASTPEASVGRWRREMDPELVKRFNDELGKELEALGFDTSVPERDATLTESPATSG
jgi:Sulfotransferase family